MYVAKISNELHARINKSDNVFFEGYVFTLHIFMYTLAKRSLIIALFNWHLISLASYSYFRCPVSFFRQIYHI